MSYTDWMREGYARYSSRDFSFADEYFAPDIRWNVPGPQGEIRGVGAVKEFFAGLEQMFSQHRIDLVSSQESDDALWCHVRHTLTRHDGSDHEVGAVHMWRIVDGRAAAMDEVADTLAFAIAAEMIPEEALAGIAG